MLRTITFIWHAVYESNIYVSVSYINCGIRKQLTFSWTVHDVRIMHQKCHLIY